MKCITVQRTLLALATLALPAAAEQTATAALDLSLDKTLLNETGETRESLGGPRLSEQEQQLAERLRIPEKVPQKPTTDSKQEPLSVSGGLISNAGSGDSGDLLQNARDQLDGIDGARVDIDMKF